MISGVNLALSTEKREKKNDFKLLFDLVENGIARGEKRRGYWGVKYERSVDKICDIFVQQIQNTENEN